MDQAQFEVLEEIEAADLQSLIDQVAVPPTKTGVARTAEIAAALQTSDLDELIALQEKLEGIIDRILANTIDPDDTGLLTDDELHDLMVERLDQSDIEKLIKLRYSLIRTRVFAHITEDNRLHGVSDPEHAPGEARVVALGKRFTREGGRAKALLDHERLRKALGEALWAQVSRAEVIPARTEYHLDEAALLKLVRNDPKMLLVIKDCVIPGGYGAVRFHIRPIPTE